MAKKSKDAANDKKEEVTEEIVEEEESVEEFKLDETTNTIIDKHGFTWKVDKDGQKIERV